MSTPADNTAASSPESGGSILRRALLQSGLLLGLAAIGALAFARLKPPPSAEVAQEITIEEVSSKLAGEKILWIDARPAAVFAERHFPGAVWLADEKWEEGLPQFVEAWMPGQPIVVYCSSTQCGSSRSVARRLVREFEATRVYYLHGGWDVLQSLKP